MINLKFLQADICVLYYSVKSRSIVTILYGYKCQIGEGVRGEFNFVFDIEIVFVVRRRTGTGGGGLGSCEELAVAMVWQSSGRGPVPGPGLATAQLPSHCHCQVPERRAECQSVWVTRRHRRQWGHPGRCHTVTTPWSQHSPHTQTGSRHQDSFMSYYPHRFKNVGVKRRQNF